MIKALHTKQEATGFGIACWLIKVVEIYRLVLYTMSDLYVIIINRDHSSGIVCLVYQMKWRHVRINHKHE